MSQNDQKQTESPKGRIVTHFIKELSFNTPNIAKLLKNRNDTPELDVELNVEAAHLDGAFYESVITFKAKAVGKAGVVYDVDLKHASLVELNDAKPEQMEKALLLETPRHAFPFLRRFVADLTRESGFPPLLLDPVDFAAIYATRQKQDADEVTEAAE